MRVHEALWPTVQASVGAGVAWWITHGLLGHPSPFFAPIAAAVSLSTSPVQRGRRALQLMGGVLVGIAVAELLASVLATSALSIGLVVIVTLTVSLVLGIGLFGQGLMFVNQAAASAILVVALHRHGTGGERAIDAIVGGATAFVIGVVLFPVHPLRLLYRAERAVLVSLATALEQISMSLVERRDPDPEWALAVGHDIHRQLSGLAAARATAAGSVTMAPRRMRLRGAVADEDRRVARLHLLANAVLSLVRRAISALEDREPMPGDLTRGIDSLAHSLGELAGTPQPWPDDLVAAVRTRTSALVASIAPQAAYGAPVLATITRRTAHDLLAALGDDPGTGERR